MAETLQALDRRIREGLQTGRMTKKQAQAELRKWRGQQAKSEGLVGSFAQGALITGPETVARTANALTNAFMNRQMQAGAEEAGLTQPLPRFEMPGSQRMIRQGGEKVFETLFSRPPREVTTAGGRLARKAGEGAFEGALTAPVAALGARAAPAVLANMAAGTAGATAGEVGQALGGTPGEIAGSIGGELAFGGVGGLARGALRRFGGARFRSKEAEAIASEIFQQSVSSREEAIGQLRAETDPANFGRALSSQVLQDTSPGVARIGVRGAARSASFNRDATRIRRANLELAEAAAARDFAGGSADTAVATYRELMEASRKQYDEAYAQVGDVGGVPLRPIQAQMALILEDAGPVNENLLPKRVMKRFQDILESGADTTSIKELVQNRKALGREIRKAKRKGELEKVRYAVQLSKSIDDTLDFVAEQTSGKSVEALRRANRLFREHKSTFREDSLLDKVLGGDQVEDVQKHFQRFLNTSERPAEELGRVMNLFGDNPDAQRGLQQMVRETIFGPGFANLRDDAGEQLSKQGVNAANAALRKNRGAFDAVYGQGAHRRAQQFLGRARTLSLGSEGTLAQNAPTGIQLLDQLELRHTGILNSLRGSKFSEAAVKLFIMATGAPPQTLREADDILLEAMLDPKKAEGLLRKMPRNQIERWRNRFRPRNVALPVVRAGIGADNGQQQQ